MFSTTVDRDVFKVVVQRDERILVGGAFTNVNGGVSRALVRLLPDGTVDPSFQTQIVAPQFGGVNDIAVLPDGRIIIVGSFTKVNGVTKNRMARLFSDGRLDESYVAPAYAPYSNIALQSDGKLVFGYFEFVRRLNADGTIDTNFNVTLNDFSEVSAVAVQRDQKILIGGDFSTVDGVPRPGVARLNSDGTVDSAFNTTGQNLGTECRTFLELDDDCIFMGGDFMAKLTAGGRLTNDFAPYHGNIDGVAAMVFLDGKLVVGGHFDGFDSVTQSNFARLSSNGVIDETFGLPTGANQRVRSISITHEHALLVAGRFTSFNGEARPYLVRVLWDQPFLRQYQIDSGCLQFSWPAAYTNFVLQTASSLPGTNWLAVTNSPVVISNVNYVTNSTTSGNQFFRLVRP